MCHPIPVLYGIQIQIKHVGYKIIYIVPNTFLLFHYDQIVTIHKMINKTYYFLYTRSNTTSLGFRTNKQKLTINNWIIIGGQRYILCSCNSNYMFSVGKRMSRISVSNLFSFSGELHFSLWTILSGFVYEQQMLINHKGTWDKLSSNKL